MLCLHGSKEKKAHTSSSKARFRKVSTRYGSEPVLLPRHLTLQSPAWTSGSSFKDMTLEDRSPGRLICELQGPAQWVCSNWSVYSLTSKWTARSLSPMSILFPLHSCAFITKKRGGWMTLIWGGGISKTSNSDVCSLLIGRRQQAQEAVHKT